MQGDVETKTEVLRERQKEREGTRARDKTHLVIEERSLPGPHWSRTAPQRTRVEAGTPWGSLEGGLGWATDRPQPQESHCPGVGVRTLCSRREGDRGLHWEEAAVCLDVKSPPGLQWPAPALGCAGVGSAGHHAGEQQGGASRSPSLRQVVGARIWVYAAPPP